MIIADELKALGAPEWLLLHIEKTVRGSFFLPDLLRPLVLQLGLQDEKLKRQHSKLLQQKQELDAKNRRIANLTKEKLGWEATNHKRNEYIEELKKAKKDAEQETTRVKRVYNELKLVTFGTRYGVDVKEFVARCTPGPELQAVYCAWRAIRGYKVPEPEQPYVPFRDKTTWDIGDRVSIMHGLAGTVHSVSRRGAHVVQSVGIQTDDVGGVRTVHWLERKMGGVGLEYRGHSTRMTK
jgi:hypothetical protein